MKGRARKGDLIVFLTLFALFALAVDSVLAIPTVRMETPYLDKIVGDILTIDVRAYDVTDEIASGWTDEVISFGFKLTYVQLAFSFNGAIAGPDFELLNSNLSYPADVVGFVPFPGPSGANVLLATLNFTALASGAYSIGLFSDLTDPNQGLSTFLYGDDTVFSGPDNRILIDTSLDFRISDAPTPVPEPASIVLFSAGLAGLAAVRRRSRSRV